MDLAPELPVLDGDSGKTAGVVIFFGLLLMLLRSKPLEGHRQAEFFMHLRQAVRRASRAFCLTIL